MIRLVSCDMDGTLLDENSQLPPETFELVRELQAAGIRFCVNSGRRADTLHTFWGEVADEIDYVASNGSQVIAAGEVLCDVSFPVADLEALQAVVEPIGCLALMVHTAEHRFWMRPQEELAAFATNWDDRLVELAADGTPYEQFARKLPDEPVFKTLVLNARPAELADFIYVLTREVGDRFEFIPYSSEAIDVTPHGMSKASGLELLARHYGLAREEIAAFGDSMNDYDMLRYAGRSYAMENGIYLIRALASRQLGTNRAHAVQAEFRRILEEGRA